MTFALACVNIVQVGLSCYPSSMLYIHLPVGGQTVKATRPITLWYIFVTRDAKNPTLRPP